MSDSPAMKTGTLRFAGALLVATGCFLAGTSFADELLLPVSFLAVGSLVAAILLLLRAGYPSREPAPRALGLLSVIILGLSALSLTLIETPFFATLAILLGGTLLILGVTFGIVTLRTRGLRPSLAVLPLILCIALVLAIELPSRIETGLPSLFPGLAFAVIGVLFILLARPTAHPPTDPVAPNAEPIDRPHPLALSPEDLDALTQVAAEACDRREFSESNRLAEQVLSQDPRHFGAQLIRSRALAGLRRWGEARLSAEELRRQHPLLWMSHTEYALVDIEIQAVTAWTVEAAREGVRLAPDEPTAHSVLGDVHLKLGELQNAATAYREALRLDPDDSHARHNLAVAERFRQSAAKTGSAFADVLVRSPDLDVAAKNIVATLEKPLYWLRLILIAAYLLAFVTLGLGLYSGSSPATVDVQLPWRLIVGIVALIVIAIVGLWFARFFRAAAPRGGRLIRAALRLDRGLGLVAALYAVAVLSLAAIPLLSHPWPIPAFIVGAGAGILAVGVGFIRFLMNIGN